MTLQAILVQMAQLPHQNLTFSSREANMEEQNLESFKLWFLTYDEGLNPQIERDRMLREAMEAIDWKLVGYTDDDGRRWERNSADRWIINWSYRD